MLVEFSVGDYQAFGATQRVPIKPITLIFGPNGAGKSALLKSLLVSRHAVMEGKLQKSQGALDRHPGTFKAMQRNKTVREESPSIRFGWTLNHAEKDTNSTARLEVQWAEVTSLEIHTQRLALYCNERLFIEDEGKSPVKFGPHLDGELNASIEKVLGKLPLEKEDHPVLHEKIKETLLGELELDYEGWLFPGSVEGYHAFNFSDDLPKKLHEALSSHIPNSRRLNKLIKWIEDAALVLLRAITESLREFHESLKTELELLVYHGPIRPVYDEIKTTDTSAPQLAEWLKMAGDDELCEKVNNWLSSTAGNHPTKVVISRAITMHDVKSIGFDNISWDDVLESAYALYMLDRFNSFNSMSIYWSEEPSSVSAKHKQALLDWVADRLAHDGDISAVFAEAVVELGVSLAAILPAHYKGDADGNYAADLSEIPRHLRHPQPHPGKAWEEFDQLNEEQRLDAARAYHALLAGREEIKRIEDFLLKGINNLLSDKVLRLEDPHQETDLHKVLFVDSRTNQAVQASNLGLGFSQMLPLVISAFACEDQLIAIEQPELHVHPALQTELADLFIQSAKERSNRFLIETHSEHLILRVMKRIRQTYEGKLPEGKPPITHHDVCILYVEPGENGSIVREMPLNERGELIKGWPGGFFEEALNEMF